MRALVVLNRGSGSLAKLGIDRGRERVAASCEANNLAATIALVPGHRISHRIQDELSFSQEGTGRRFDVVVVGGGDGSVSAAASVLAGSDLPLGILPLGTLNHFARDLGLPLDLEGAIRLIASGRVSLVDVGEVNGRVFLNNSSLGIYPQLVAKRDRYRRHGPTRWLAAAFALCHVLWRLPRPKVRVLAPGWKAVRRTTCLFIANNIYQFNALASAKRMRLDQGELCLHMANAQSRLSLLRLAIRALFGRLEPDRDFTQVSLQSAEISVRRRRVRVALDGESLVFRPPLLYRIRPRALRVIVPEPASS
jgi:diacylglycerol kinase family enzyme